MDFTTWFRKSIKEFFSVSDYISTCIKTWHVILITFFLHQYLTIMFASNRALLRLEILCNLWLEGAVFQFLKHLQLFYFLFKFIFLIWLIMQSSEYRDISTTLISSCIVNKRLRWFYSLWTGTNNLFWFSPNLFSTVFIYDL
jgi:hypothetical protein